MASKSKTKKNSTATPTSISVTPNPSRTETTSILTPTTSNTTAAPDLSRTKKEITASPQSKTVPVATVAPQPRTAAAAVPLPSQTAAVAVPPQSRTSVEAPHTSRTAAVTVPPQPRTTAAVAGTAPSRKTAVAAQNSSRTNGASAQPRKTAVAAKNSNAKASSNGVSRKTAAGTPNTSRKATAAPTAPVTAAAAPSSSKVIAAPPSSLAPAPALSMAAASSSKAEHPPPLQLRQIRHFVYKMVAYTMGVHGQPYHEFDEQLKTDEILFHGNIWKAAYHQNLVYYSSQKVRLLGWDWDEFAAMPPPMCAEQVRQYMIQLFSVTPLIVPRIGYPISATLLGLSFFCLLCRFAQFLDRPELVNLVACEFELLIKGHLRTKEEYSALASDSGAIVGRLNDLEKERFRTQIEQGVPIFTNWLKEPLPQVPTDECPYFYYRMDFHPFIV